VQGGLDTQATAQDIADLGGGGSSSGAAGEIQLSDGAGGFNSDSTLNFDVGTSTLQANTIAGKFGSFDATLTLGGSSVIVVGGNVSDLANDAGYLTAAVTDVTGTTNRITSSGGATPAIDISASYVGQGSITTVGTLSSGNATAIVDAASASAAGKVELAIASEIDTGTDSTRAMPVDQFVASKRNVRHLLYRVLADTANATDSVNPYGGAVPLPIAGTIIAVAANNDTAGVTGTATYDIHLNGTTIMASTKISIETGETDSRDATTQPTITTSTVAVKDLLTFYVDADQTTIAKGLTFTVSIREA
jgi:hypothetical protein